MDTQGLLNKLLKNYNQFYHDNNPETTSRERTKSFIYGYFLNEKKRELAKYTERKTDFFKGVAALVKGLTIESAEDLLKITDKSVKIRDNYLLLAISREAFESGWISEEELRAVIKKTRKIKKVPPVLFQRENAGYGAAWERYLRILLHKTICDFFNSKGFVVNGSGSDNHTAKRNGRFSTKKREPDDRKERDLVHLYSEYHNYQKAHSEQSGKITRGRFSENATKSAAEYKERAKRLLRAIDDNSVNHAKYKRDIIPIYFDEKIGAGIYLIGKECFEPTVLEKADIAQEIVCVPCIVSFYSAVYDNLGRFVYAKKLENNSEPIKARFEMNVEPCATLDKAFEQFARKINNHKFDKDFRYSNQSVCPLSDEDFKRIM